ncbi:hypothetical protein HDF16_002403 [Granulicella aggregans]|uniref:Outer membrane protein beta-barrel domain-containing protein n=1 Tax=Granulicella aggregans TaxID=474949 RepID=A0A7W7ZD90_9BACT|nr:hypothetical protein [Granulicella aggregans]MBB5057697.1 hypothetical protein [Granulicella aggregans]
MRISISVLASLLFLSTLSAVASAQIAVYGTFSPTRIQGIATGNNAAGGYKTSNYWAYAVGGGATLTLLPLGPLSLGVDVRGSTQPGTQGADTVLAGLKLGAKLPAISYKPYVQVSGGYLNTRSDVATGLASGSTNHQGFAAYEVLAGIDHRIAPLIDFRVLEAGVGRGIFVNGPNSNVPNVTFVTLSTGLVFRF